MSFGIRALAFLSLTALLHGGELHLKNRVISTSTASAGNAPGSIKRLRPGSSHWLLQFQAPVTNGTLSELARRGAVVTAAIPDHAVMASVPDGFTSFGMNVEYSGRLTVPDKLSAGLAAEGTAESVVEFHSDVDPSSARLILMRSNLHILHGSGLLPNHFLVRAMYPQLRMLAEFDEVAYIFPASLDLNGTNGLSGCIGALTQSGAVPQYALVGHGWEPDAKGQVDVSYVFHELTSKLPADQVKGEIERAFREWGKHAPVTFTEVTDSTALRTIDIEFAGGAHNDPFAFDGPGGILAHTFYPAPPNPEPLAGDMHFDAEEAWHVGTSTDIFTVALHETGHALGLGHSDDPASVMYPYYRFGKELNSSDIAGIQALYGKPSNSAVSSVNPSLLPVAPSTPSNNPVPVTPSANPAAVLPLAFTVDNVPHNQIFASDARMNFTGHAANFSGSIHITWQTDHSASGVATGQASWTAANIPLVSGANTITFMATDDLQRSATQVVQVNRQGVVAAAVAAPGVTITSPAVSIISTDQAAITMKGTADSSIGISSVTWQVFGRTGTATGTSNWSASIPLYTGTNQITIKAYDYAGGTRSASITVVRN